MNFLATERRRKVLFGLLYLSEGAPIGFIWLGLPTRQRVLDVPVDRIAWLMAILILPWTLKFLWAPLVDLLRGPRWGYKQWILASQSIMVASILPLLTLDLRTQFPIIAGWLIIHAIAAATQDIAIDALAIQQSAPLERGALNGWMQCGMLAGRAIMGGGSLVLESYIGFNGVIFVLIGLISLPAMLLVVSKSVRGPQTPESKDQVANGKDNHDSRATEMYREILQAMRLPKIWLGFLFALTAPAAFKSLEAILGPFLIDRGYSEVTIGTFTATAVIFGMIIGSSFAGRMANRFQSDTFVAVALAVNLLMIFGLATTDMFGSRANGWSLLVAMTLVSFTIGWFTVALYNWLMNLTSPKLAATQFTAFMAATNGCEAWSTALFGTIQVSLGYPIAIYCLTAISTSFGFGIFLLLRVYRAMSHLPAEGR